MRPILPGSTLGILGGGQLGRMLALEARRMGYRVIVLDPAPDSPCGQVADEQVVASFDDSGAHLRLGARCDVVTYEFENVDLRCVEALESAGRIVRPAGRVLRVTQDRLLEKKFARRAGIATVDFRGVESAEDLEAAAREIGFPAVLKTVRGGYDGKGQAVVRTIAEARRAFERLGLGGGVQGGPRRADRAGDCAGGERPWRGKTLIWERRVPFVKELGVVCARGLDGETAAYPVTENVHVENILDAVVVPARIPAAAERRAKRAAEALARELGLVGVFCVELFLLRDGRVLVNELAPRPHNSGHYTIDACATSQFEQQLRAVCGLPLGSAELRSKAAMVNLLGAGTGDRLMGVDRALRDPSVKLHLYGKSEAKPKRKMGHVTALGRSPAEALRRARRAARFLRWGR